ncbi:MAG: type II CAAX endopeptidase family protein [Pseudomonadota bacterium]
MTSTSPLTARQLALIEFLGIVIIGHLVKAALDQLIWRYSGPIALALTLSVFVPYLRWRGASFADLGLVAVTKRRQWLLLLPQTLLAFLLIPASGAGIAFAGESLGFAFMAADPTGPQMRFGDLEGNTPLYLSWIPILWFAGPAEELYFRGIMIHQLGKGLGPTRLGTALTLFVPALVFGVGHLYYQGPRGLITTGVIGLTLGILYLAYRRNLWPLMIAHAAFNTLTFTAMYKNWDV